jgi:hypothetical protein
MNVEYVKMPSRRSETFRKGEPDSHKDAVRNLAIYLQNHGINCRKDYPLKKGKYYHEYDLVGFVYNKEVGLIFNNSEFHDNEKLLKWSTKKVIDFMIDIVVEVGDIGDDSKHNPGHKSQLIKDGIAERHAEESFPESSFFRINKDDSWYPSWIQKKLGL